MKGTRMRPALPRTLFSTPFRSSAGAVRRRLGNLFAPGRKNGGLVAAAALVLVVFAGGLVACTLPAEESPEETGFSNIPEEVVVFAQEYAAESMEELSGDSGAFTAIQVTSITGEGTFSGILPDADLEVYQVVYRLKAADPDMMLAGGSWIDDEGWYHPDSFAYYLVVELSGETRTLLGSTSTDGTDAGFLGGWEGILGNFLIRQGSEAGDEAMIQAGRQAFLRGKLDQADQIMDCFRGEATPTGQPYTDSEGHTWYQFADFQDTSWRRMDDQILSQSTIVFPHEVSTQLFQRYVYTAQPVILQFDDALWFREDSADLLSCGYHVDTSAITITKWEDDFVQFYAPDGDDPTVRWYFTLAIASNHPELVENGVGSWVFLQYFDLSCEGIADLETSFTVDGASYALGTSVTGLLGTPYGTTTDDTYGDGVYSYAEWYGSGGSTSASYFYNPARGSLALRALVTSDLPSLTTWRGIHLGSTMEEARAAYPDGEWFSDGVNTEPTDWRLFLTCPDGEGGTYQLVVAFYDKDLDGVIDRLYLSDSRV